MMNLEDLIQNLIRHENGRYKTESYARRNWKI